MIISILNARSPDETGLAGWEDYLNRSGYLYARLACGSD
jgi:hypothetical protein